MNRFLARRNQPIFALFFAACVFAGSCETYESVATSMLMMSPEKEVELGKQVAAELEKDLVFVNDPALVQYVRKLGSYVTGYAPKKAEVPTQFFVVHNPEINAFAIPGGNMYVHTGLLEAATDESEILGVLAHEYGHVVYRHSAKQVALQTGPQILQSFISGTDAAAAALVVQVGSSVVMQKYSRKDELEADSIAVPTLYACNYDPNGMVTLFQKLKDRYGEQAGPMIYFSSHPATSERIQRVQANIAALPPKQFARPVEELRQAKARIEALGLSGKDAGKSK